MSPVPLTLTGGERHEQTALVEILDVGAVRRPGPGRPRLRPRRLAGDKASAGRPVRTHLRRRGLQPVIPSKKGQPRNPFFDDEAYRLRNRIERLINRLKQCRRIATRYEPEGPAKLKAGGQLSGNDHHRSDSSLALSFADTP